MKRLAALLTSTLLCAQAALAQTDILFVGNSFTHGNIQPAYSYNNSQVTDANGTNQGGVPGIFKQLTVQQGLNYNVTIEAVSGQTLEYHFNNKAPVIGQPKWDTVVLQEFSTRPLPANRGGNLTAFYTFADNLQNLVLANNPAASLFLYETWARPDQVFPPTSAYGRDGLGLSAMQDDLRAAYNTAGATFGFNGVAPVGDAFLRAVDQGLADPDSYYNGTTPGRFQLWDTDNYHASRYGSYLSATVLFAEITGVDPRTLAVGAGTAAAGLGIGLIDAANLNRIAYEQVFVVPEPSTVNLVVFFAAGACLVWFTRCRRRQVQGDGQATLGV